MSLETSFERIAAALEQIAANGQGTNSLTLEARPETQAESVTPKRASKSRTAVQAETPTPAQVETPTPVSETSYPRPVVESAVIPEPVAVEAAPVAAFDPTTYADVQAAAHAYSQVGDREGVLDIFGTLGGIKNLKELQQDRYAEAVAKFNAAAALVAAA